jgi:hypothetical protein
MRLLLVWCQANLHLLSIHGLQQRLHRFGNFAHGRIHSPTQDEISRRTPYWLHEAAASNQCMPWIIMLSYLLEKPIRMTYAGTKWRGGQGTW